MQIGPKFGWRLAKWLGLLFESYFLFVFVNVALLIPYPYDRKRVFLVIAGGLIAGLCGFLSSLGMIEISKEKARANLKALTAVPVLMWGAIIAITCLILSPALEIHFYGNAVFRPQPDCLGSVELRSL